VLFIRGHVGSYAVAGATAAAFGAALGLTSPVLGRLIDRRGLRTVAVPGVAMHAACMLGLVAAGLASAPPALCIALAAGAGAFLPPLGSISRSLWPVLLRDEDPELVGTALALEGVLIEVIFTVGPLLVAAIAALADASIALVLSPVLLLVGWALFLMQPPVQAWEVSEHAGSHGALGALRSPGIRTLMLCTIPMGFCFGAMEVTLPAFAEDHGSRTLAGVLIAAWALGSAAGGVWYGARAWRSTPGRRYARLAALLPLGYLPLAAAPSIPVMVPLAFLAGVCIAPTLTAGNQIAGQVAPLGAETEAYTWPVTSLVSGLAVGNWAAGAIVDAASWQAAFLVSAAGAGLAALLAATRWRTLEGRRVEPAYEAAL
jgi:MFS family permease